MRALLKVKELWFRLWCKIYGYEWSFPFCNRLTCPFNDYSRHQCRIVVKLSYWYVMSFDERYCPLEKNDAIKNEIRIRSCR